MMLVLNAESFRESPDQVLFVHLGVALDGVVFDAFGDVAQFGEGFVFQFFDCVRHAKLLWRKMISRHLSEPFMNPAVQRSDRDGASGGPGNRERNIRGSSG